MTETKSSINIRWRGVSNQMYMVLQNGYNNVQEFSQSVRTFESPTDDGTSVYHEIYVTPTSFIWEMDNPEVLNKEKQVHNSTDNNQFCFTKAFSDYHESVAANGSIQNFMYETSDSPIDESSGSIIEYHKWGGRATRG